MKSAWMIESRRAGKLRREYQVYRLLDNQRPDAEGNREYFGCPTPDRRTAQALADVLNEKEAMA